MTLSHAFAYSLALTGIAGLLRVAAWIAWPREISEEPEQFKHVDAEGK